jgi:peptide chain release factor 2
VREYKEIRRELEILKEKSNELYAAVNIEGERTKMAEYEKMTFEESFWADQENAAKINQEISRLRRHIAPWNVLLQEISDSLELLEIAEAESDSSVQQDIDSSIEKINSDFDRIQTLELLSDPDDIRNAYITVHPGAGGTESQDWASMLYRMYVRWAERSGYGVEVIDSTPGEEAGIKSATILISGEYAYGFAKCEMGVHRLVRISPFDANKRRHTSFASVEVTPEIDDTVQIDISESDLRVDTFRSSGAGGQHVNTTDSAIRITHIPTGIVTQCQNERSQHKNKAAAMKMLRAKLYDHIRKEMDAKIDEKAGEKKDISWGNQIRSYVFQPYTLVKDHRTGEEVGSVQNVMDGEINPFIQAYLKEHNKQQKARAK